MFELIRANQLNLMLILCGACGILVFLLLNTRFLSKTRKLILILLEVMAFFILWFDRLAYIYAGDVSHKGYVMVRVSNFMVFFLTSGIVFGFTLYVTDLLKVEGGLEHIPLRMNIAGGMSVAGMLLAILAAITGLYYYFDSTNHYHRGSGFLIAYIIPVLCPLLQYTVVRKYKEKFSRLIYSSLFLYILIPIICGILQIFTYGISIVNMSLVAVSVFLYVFMYLDLNNTVEHAHQIEIENMQGEHARMQRLFDQTATAFVSAVETKDGLLKGNSLKIAEYSKRIAVLSGKSEEESEKVYYAALLHDVGLIGIPDSVIASETDPEIENGETIRKKPLIGEDILSSITEYPYLSQGARYSHEKYNGTGYPEGLKGNEIPEIARIIAVADAYVSMTTQTRYRDAMPDFLAREAFVKGAGEDYDPLYAQIMISILDSKSSAIEAEKSAGLDKEMVCREYRKNISAGIQVEEEVIRIGFDCGPYPDEYTTFSMPSVILFDSFDGRCHDNAKSIESYHYLEYGEVWFDEHSVTTGARKITDTILDAGDDTYGSAITDSHFEIIAGRYDDHVKLVVRSKALTKVTTIALPGATKAAYIALTGENCRLTGITVEPEHRTYGPDDIERIMEPISYIDHFESDIKNVQINRSRCAYSEPVEVDGRVRLDFHTMSFPGSELIWHCPYVVLYRSDDGRVNGQNYREYAMIKLNGENDVIEGYVSNRYVMKKTDEFPGWDEWREANKKGLDCEISIERRGSRVTMKTENLGISIENVSTIREDVDRIYVALTGDQVALTDIRTYRS